LGKIFLDFFYKITELQNLQNYYNLLKTNKMKRTVIILAVAVAGLLTGGNVSAQSSCCSEGSVAAVSTPDKSKGKETTSTLSIQGSCDMCKSKIEKTAQGIDGVSKAQWDKKTKVLSVTYDKGKTSLDNVSKAIAKIGYDTEKHKADSKAYDALASCCKYRK
jgi:Cu(I)/Ag(I) efflux system membrane fusion protein